MQLLLTSLIVRLHYKLAFSKVSIDRFTQFTWIPLSIHPSDVKKSMEISQRFLHGSKNATSSYLLVAGVLGQVGVIPYLTGMIGSASKTCLIAMMPPAPRGSTWLSLWSL